MGLHGVRLTGRDERDVHRQLFRHPDHEQVRMERSLGDPVKLDAVDEDGPWLVAIDREVHEGIRAGLPAKELELVGVHRDVRGLESVTEHDRGELAGLAQAHDGLAGDVTGRGREGRARCGHVWAGPPES